ncbi:MAG TPA: DMT family transporter [Solirubrobacteraceae bacterium]|nr:DMT family transporter [Solirubrobacteraceae bacterium]
MNRGEAISLTIASGLLVGLQPAANAALADHVGDFGAAFVSIVITLLVAAIVLVIAGHPGRLSGLGSAAPVQLIGGVGGAAVVIVSLITVRTLGTGGVVALIVAAQLVIAIFIDRFGWFGIHQIAISPVRLIGLGLVIAGTVLITRA